MGFLNPQMRYKISFTKTDETAKQKIRRSTDAQISLKQKYNNMKSKEVVLSI